MIYQSPTVRLRGFLVLGAESLSCLGHSDHALERQSDRIIMHISSSQINTQYEKVQATKGPSHYNEVWQSTCRLDA